MSGGLTKKVGIIGASRMLATSVNVLVANMFLSRHLDQATYGTFQQTWFLTHMAMELALLGTPIAVLYFLPKLTPGEQKGFFVRLGGAMILLGAIASSTLYAAAPFIAAAFENPALEGTLRTMSWYALLVLPCLPMDAVLIALGRHAALGLVTVGHSLLFIIAVVAPAMAGLSISLVLWAIVGYGLVRSGLLYGTASAALGSVKAVSPKGLLAPFIAYAVPVGLNDVIRVVARWLDKNVVSLFFDPETFAVYVNGAIEIPFVAVFAGAISAVVIPEFSRLSESGQREKIVDLWHRTIAKTAAVMMPLFVFLMVTAPAFLVILFSERYRESAFPFRVYLLLLPLRSATYTPILFALGKSRLVAIGAIADLFLNVILSIGLIPIFGYLAPAVATVISTHLQAAFYLKCGAGLLQLPLRTAFPWGIAGRVLGLAALPAAILVPAVLVMRGPLEILLVGAAAYFPLYTFLLWRFGPLTEGDKATVTRFLGKLRR